MQNSVMIISEMEDSRSSTDQCKHSENTNGSIPQGAQLFYYSHIFFPTNHYFIFCFLIFCPQLMPLTSQQGFKSNMYFVHARQVTARNCSIDSSFRCRMLLRECLSHNGQGEACQALRRFPFFKVFEGHLFRKWGGNGPREEHEHLKCLYNEPVSTSLYEQKPLRRSL